MKMKYIKFVRSLGKNDTEKKKTIDTINFENKESDLYPAKTKPVDKTLRVFTRCSTCNWEKSYKPAKLFYSSCSFTHRSGYYRKKIVI